MLAIAGFVIGGVLVLGFYGYVFLQLYREHQRVGALEKRLSDHLVGMDAENESESDSPRKFTKHARHETLIQVGVAIGGLVGIFAEIGLLNQLVDSFR
jgi:hypothetical protein